MTDYVEKIHERVTAAGFEGLLPLVRCVTKRHSFSCWPASVGVNGKPWHHGDEGGLARHTWQVLDLALHMAAAHGIDAGPLAVAAVWHDIGKLDCYVVNPEGGFRKNPEHHSHHITVGLTWWGVDAPSIISRCDQRTGDAGIFRRVRHMIESHHGRREWGSPSEPATLEALILHHADMQSVMFDKTKHHENEH